MANTPQSPDWIALYEVLLAEIEPAKQRELLETVEVAIVDRHQELALEPDSVDERLALKMAADKILEIKLTKLGFPGWDGNHSSWGEVRTRHWPAVRDEPAP
jgi:hypothetical protein